MSQAVSQDVLPNISFTDHAIQLIGTSVEHLAISNNTSGEFLATAKNVKTAIREYSDLTENMVDHYNDLMPIRDIANAFAKQLHNGIKSLSNIKKTVTRLVDNTISYAHDEMLKDASLAVTMENINDTILKFSKINWEKLDVVDEQSIFITHNASLGLGRNQSPNTSQINILINRLPFGTPYNNPVLERIDINKEAAKETFNAVFKQLKAPVQAKDVKYVLSMLFDLDSYKCFSAINTLRTALTDSTQINSMLTMVRDFAPVLNAVTEDTLKFSTTTKQLLLDRKEILKKYVDATAYICSYFRNTVWKDAILVPGNRLNPDVWVDFRKQGGSSIALAQHMTHFYSDSEVPQAGVSTNSVITSRAHVLECATEAASTQMAEIDRKKRDILRNAFIYHGQDWLLKNKSKWSNEFTHANNPTAFTSAIYDSNSNAPLESMFYKLIINACCPNTIVNQLYQNLSDIYLKHAAVGGELTTAQCEALDMTVYTNMITDFLIKKQLLTVETDK